MKKVLGSSIFIFILLCFLTACDANLAKYAGVYEGQYMQIVGDKDVKDTDNAFSLELKADGTGKHNHDGESYDVTWTVSGEEFQMTEEFLKKIEYHGTIKDGKLDLFNGDANDVWTYEYVYEKKHN